MDDWDWDELEVSPPKGTTTTTQRPAAQPPPTVTYEEIERNGKDAHSYHQKDTLHREVQEHTLNTDSKANLDKDNHSLSRLTCERRQEQWLLCQDTCGCQNSMPNLGSKTRIIQDYGLNSGISDLISNTHIAIGEVAAIFGETSTVGDQQDVDEFDRIATQHNTTANARQFEFYVSGDIPGNQGHFHII